MLTLAQSGADTQVALLGQVGNSNTMTVSRQGGLVSSVLALQDGDRNQMTLTQSGDNNQAQLTQEGSENTMKPTQLGDNRNHQSELSGLAYNLPCRESAKRAWSYARRSPLRQRSYAAPAAFAQESKSRSLDAYLMPLRDHAKSIAR